MVEAGDDRETEAARRALEPFGIEMNDIEAVTYQESQRLTERLQGPLESIMIRRDSVLREIDRRRDAVARRLREATAAADHIVDVQFE